MAKRFTDTDKWKRPWFRGLELKAKVLWFYLLDTCDHAGIWIADFEFSSFAVGFKFSEQDLLKWFAGKVTKVDSDKFVILSFYNFQYGHANEKYAAKKSAAKTLVRLGILNEDSSFRQDINEGGGDSRSLPGDSQETPEDSIESPSISISMSMGMDMGKDPEKPKAQDLMEVWNQNRGSLPKAMALSKTRISHAEARLKENPDLEFWAHIVRQLASSRFCTGNNDKGWKADFDFLLKPDTHLKTLEGKYANKSNSNSPYGISLDL